MDDTYGAVDVSYMKKAAALGDPFACLHQRILVLPNRPAPSGFRQFEVDAYWPKEVSDSGSSKYSRSRTSKKRRSSSSTSTGPPANKSSSKSLANEVAASKKERKQQRQSSSSATSKRTASQVDGEKPATKRPSSKQRMEALMSKEEMSASILQAKKRVVAAATHRVPSRRVGKTLGAASGTDMKISSKSSKATSSTKSAGGGGGGGGGGADCVTLPTKSAAEIALQKLQRESKAAAAAESGMHATPLLLSPTQPLQLPQPPPTQNNVPLSPRASKTASMLASKVVGKNSVPASMIPTLRAKVSRAYVVINETLSRRISIPPSGASQAAQVLKEVADSVQGALVIREESGMIDSLSHIVDKFLKLDSSKNEIVTPSLMCLSSLCRRFSQLADLGHGSAAVASAEAAAAPPTLCSMIACQALLQLSIRCVVHLHDLVSKQPSNEALESGVPRLAASAHLLKGLAEYCTLTSDPPTPRELKSRDMFVVGGGATVLLALSQSNLKTTSRPARVALANFDMKDLELIASTGFELEHTCQLTIDPLAATLSTMASGALKAEMSKRNKQKHRAQAILRKQSEAKEASKRTLEERQEKLEQWLGKRDEEQLESREKWKQRDQKQKAMLAAKLEADKERYALDKQQRALAAEEYRQKMLLKYQEQKQAAREREAALAESEEMATQQKREEAESKVESWLKNKRETMREERGRQLQSHRTAHRKNMKNLRHINAKSFGNTDFSDPASRQVVPGSGYVAQSIGGAKLVVGRREGGKAGGRKQQHLYGGKEKASKQGGDPLSFGVMGTSIR